MIKAVIFDVDGVLLDSAEANATFFRNLLGHFGYELPPESDPHKQNHLPMWDRIALLAESDDPSVIKPIFEYGKTRASYPEELAKPPKKLSEVLERLGRKYSLGIVTGRIREGLDEFFELSRSKEYFRVAVTYEDTERRKPDPEPLLKAAALLNVRPDECIYVGDADIDIQAAKAAGMKSILISATPDPNADVSIDDFGKIPDSIYGLAEKSTD